MKIKYFKIYFCEQKNVAVYMKNDLKYFAVTSIC